MMNIEEKEYTEQFKEDIEFTLGIIRNLRKAVGNSYFTIDELLELVEICNRYKIQRI